MNQLSTKQITMLKKMVSVLFIVSVFSANGQNKATTKIFTSDINNFWTAYDSVLKVSDTTAQKNIIQTLYLDKATAGLKNFMFLRQHSASRHLRNIQHFPKFWTSVRPKTLDIENHRQEIEKMMGDFQHKYPGFRQPDIYFTIGCLNSGGTTLSDRVLIGAEIAAADKTVDASELSDWLQSVFKAQQDIVYLVTHETVHTQQKGYNGDNLLSQCLREGSADFIASLLMNKPLNSPYITYGIANEKKIWDRFKMEMDGTNAKNWLYNGSDAKNEPADLGYFMGYTICKSYYDNAADKQKAFIDIVNLNYQRKADIDAFFAGSKYADKW
jgi:hypothetical protein